MENEKEENSLIGNKEQEVKPSSDDVTEHSRGGGILKERAPDEKKATKQDSHKKLNVSWAGPGHRRIKSDGSTQGLNGSTRSKSRIGNIYRKTGGEIHTITSPAPATGDGVLTTDAEASWNDVYRTCCCHTAKEWINIFGFIVMLLLVLYFFLVGLDLLGTSFAIVGGCTAGSLLGSNVSPLSSVMIGVIATALLQSSSTTTSIIVSLVSGGLDVRQGIYMTFGCGVGTTITCLLVSLAHIGDAAELQNAFSAASTYFTVNFLTLCIMFPLEVATGFLYEFTKIMLPSSVSDGSSWEGPIKKIVGPLVKTFLVKNTALIEGISGGDIASCSDRYPIQCEGNEATYEACKDTAGLIGCDKKTGKCPLFFEIGATKKDDMVSGWVCLVIALFILIACLVALVALLRKVLLGASTQIIYKATNINDYLAISIGIAVTVLVQSSSITTSTLVPLAGVGVLTIEKMFPLVLGAGVGTTCTAVMAAMVSSRVESLQIALVHLFFHVFAILIWYPIPFMRKIVFRIARLLGKATKAWRSFPLAFIIFMFFLLPIILLGLSACFEKKTKGFTALGVFLVFLIVGGIIYFVVWWRYREGKQKFKTGVRRRRRRAAALETLADEMDYLKVDTEWCKNEIGRIKDFAGLPKGAVVHLPPPVTHVTAKADDEEAQLEEEEEWTEEAERLSQYESARSKSWRNVLYSAAGSVRSELQGSLQQAPTAEDDQIQTSATDEVEKLQVSTEGEKVQSSAEGEH